MSLPAENDREKCRCAEIPMHFRTAYERTSHRPCMSEDGLPAIVIDCAPADSAGVRAKHAPTLPRCVGRVGADSVYPVNNTISACLRIVLHGGLPLSRHRA